MNKTVAEQVEEVILNHFDYGFYGFEEDFEYIPVLKKAGIKFIEDASYTEYDSYGNTSIDHKIIFQHIESGQYIALVGNYQSYNGTEWDGFIDIEKKEKVVKVWEKVN